MNFEDVLIGIAIGDAFGAVHLGIIPMILK